MGWVVVGVRVGSNCEATSSSVIILLGGGGVVTEEDDCRKNVKFPKKISAWQSAIQEPRLKGSHLDSSSYFECFSCIFAYILAFSEAILSIIVISIHFGRLQ